MNQQKLMNVWNSGIGQLLCQRMGQEQGRLIQFQQKHPQMRLKLQNQKIHYLFVLDDSYSMEGRKWENSKKAALSTMKSISQNINAKVSVIIFNHRARVVVDCQSGDLPTQSEQIIYTGGGTDFSKCFECILNQVIKYTETDLAKTVILFYTDGQANYPETQIKNFLDLPCRVKQSIQWIIPKKNQKGFYQASVLQSFYEKKDLNFICIIFQRMQSLYQIIFYLIKMKEFSFTSRKKEKLFLIFLLSLFVQKMKMCWFWTIYIKHFISIS